jgi:hypothetical protein
MRTLRTVILLLLCAEGSFNRRGYVSVQTARRLSALHTSHAPKPMARGAAIEACVPIPQSSLVTFFQRK